ncbi:hypothetical protein JG688_00012918 [Phytophthora aleatoria]|uniref:Uncharacterized protein n=1 Tax=Phytophthora aleatoria TaxID=2496075 RepID=A0A8J5IN67_9STRA|nr:hypothetical protein JG688_00012918 [Phytophthora aleatoria]
MRREFGTTYLQSVFGLFAASRQRFGTRRNILCDSRQFSLSEPKGKKNTAFLLLKDRQTVKLKKKKCHFIQKVMCTLSRIMPGWIPLCGSVICVNCCDWS